MTSTSVHDVAAYILKQRGGMSTMKLQKLCYYSQGWSLAWDSEPLFSEDIQAWANGPVCYELFKRHKGQFRVTTWPSGEPDKLTKEQRETIDAVLQAYGPLTGQQLSEKTHDERPWVEARGGLSLGAASSAVISLDAMQDFFGALAADEPAEDELSAEEIDELYDEHQRDVDREAFLASMDSSEYEDDHGYSNRIDERDWFMAQ